MAEQFLTLMADLDDDTQTRISRWHHDLKEAGFTGTQTPGLLYHISLAKFPLSEERAAIEILQRAAVEFSAVSVHISHIGIFAPGKVLFAAPEVNADLAALHDACAGNPISGQPWTPHITVLTDEPERIGAAVPIFLKSFYPITGKLVRLHLCAFWPVREILSMKLREND